MKHLIIPVKLKHNAKVASVSLSSGCAGDSDLLWKYNQGKAYIENTWKFHVVEMPHTLAGSEFVESHPEKRAEDLMKAFEDPSIKAIFSCIGGDDSIRMLPYINLDSIRDNPKPFVGYSDSTITHFICMKAGIRSYYGPSILAEMGENGGLMEYTKEYFEKTLMTSNVIGSIIQSPTFAMNSIPWVETLANERRLFQKNTPIEVLSGQTTCSGRLIGGCLDSLMDIINTELWPEAEEFNDTIFFMETSEDTPTPEVFAEWLHILGEHEVWRRVNGVLIGKPYMGTYEDEYREVLMKWIDTYQLQDKAIMYNMPFGHNEPMCVLPYGAMAEIYPLSGQFRILESGVKF